MNNYISPPSPQYGTYRGPLSQSRGFHNGYEQVEDEETPLENSRPQQSSASPRSDLAEPKKQKVTIPKHVSVMPVDDGHSDKDAHAVIPDDEEMFVPEEAKKAKKVDEVDEAEETDEIEEADEESSSRSDSPQPTRKNKRADKTKEGRGRPNSHGMPKAPVWKTSMAKLNAALTEKAKKANPALGNKVTKPQYRPSIRGRKPRWEVHIDPPLVDASSLTAAAKVKRGIPQDTEAEKVCVKATGANDPENIEIVNLKDINDLSFKEIAKIINTKRIKNGGDPNQTANSVNCRYNRTAPHLYQTQNKTFVRIADRANARGERKYTKEQEALIWDEDMDMALIKFEQEYVRSKWEVLAEKMQEITGASWPTAIEVATRHSHL